MRKWSAEYEGQSGLMSDKIPKTATNKTATDSLELPRKEESKMLVTTKKQNSSHTLEEEQNGEASMALTRTSTLRNAPSTKSVAMSYTSDHP